MILNVEKGCYGYPGGKQILKDINLTVTEGKILAVLGANGVGKTTLLKCMTGLLSWSSGRSCLCGEDIGTLKPGQIWSKVSYIPQSHSFAFSFTGLEMVLLGINAKLGLFRQPGEKDMELALDMMKKTGIERLADKDCNQMSGGELQMVLIAKALVNNPVLLILDEPETGLDFHNQLSVLDLIYRLVHENKISAVMNTHYPTNALAIADDAFIMNRDRGYVCGDINEILTEEHIANSFRVHVVVNEIKYRDKTVKSIVPVEVI